jgi:IclR family transcriptional regulator, pca regulon regulatory protein
MSRSSATMNSQQGVKESGRVRVPEGMAGLAKGLAILEAFADNKGKRLTVADAARASGATRASARRCLLTLCKLGYLEHDGKFFRPQPRILSLSLAYSEGRTLPQVAQPILAAARDALAESVSLAILNGDSSLFVARAEAERLVSSGVSIGARLPLYCSATGRILLGNWDERNITTYLERTTLVARTRRTLVKKAAILDAVRTATTLGFAISDEELELGLRSIAVPVFDSRRALIGAMSASASSARVSVTQMTRNFVPVLQQNAEKLGRAF